MRVLPEVTPRMFFAAHAPEIPGWFRHADSVAMYAAIGKWNKHRLCDGCRSGGDCDGSDACEKHRAYEARRKEWEDTIAFRWRFAYADVMVQMAEKETSCPVDAVK